MTAVRRKSFDGGDVLTYHFTHGDAAGANGTLAYQHCTCTALLDAAAVFGPRQSDCVHEMCVATFEPYIFRARGHESNFYDTTKDIAWTTEQAGVLDSLFSLDVVSKNKKVNVSKIGIMGWSYGGTVAIEAQNNFNIDLIKPKNKFALHLALYPYCFSYENSKTTNAPLFILMGDKDYLPHTLCEEYIKKAQDDLGSKNKKIIIFPGATHSYDKTGSGYVDGSIVSPECRI